jgi:hypothetical protein
MTYLDIKLESERLKKEIAEMRIEDGDLLTHYQLSILVRQHQLDDVLYEKIKENTRRNKIKAFIADIYLTRKESVEIQRPPQFATFLLLLFLSATDRDNIIGDLDERFPKWVERHGLTLARLLYVIDACTVRYSPLSRQKFSENKVDRCGSIFQAVRR